MCRFTPDKDPKTTKTLRQAVAASEKEFLCVTFSVQENMEALAYQHALIANPAGTVSGDASAHWQRFLEWVVSGVFFYKHDQT